MRRSRIACSFLVALCAVSAAIGAGLRPDSAALRPSRTTAAGSSPFDVCPDIDGETVVEECRRLHMRREECTRFRAPWPGVRTVTVDAECAELYATNDCSGHPIAIVSVKRLNGKMAANFRSVLLLPLDAC